LDHGGGKFIEFAKNWLLPIILGFVIGLAILLLFDIYRLLYSASLLIVSLNLFLRLLCTFIAFFGGYLIVRLMAENKECGCETDLSTKVNF